MIVTEACIMTKRKANVEQRGEISVLISMQHSGIPLLNDKKQLGVH